MALYPDPALPVEARASALLVEMTLAEKIGQITQVEKNSLTADDVREHAIGSVLSGGGGAPADNTPAGWRAMVSAFQAAALDTRLGIPLLYGVDAVHGHNNVWGATIFPHNIGLGAAGDPALVERIGAATAVELLATGIPWNFAPTIAVPHDIRWGRTYEGYGAETALVSTLGAAYVRGLQGGPTRVAATAKHYVGDGSTVFGTSRTENLGVPYLLDQGDTPLAEAVLRERLLPPYRAALAAGALTVMASFNSWQGTKLHAHRYLLTEVLKGELGFSGFVVSDWQAIDQITDDYAQAVVCALNAGVDMVMVPFAWPEFVRAATRAVESGAVPLHRLDDAVRRILTVKLKLGLFEQPLPGAGQLAEVGSPAHRCLARTAVQESLVLLKNDRAALPIAQDTPVVFVGGAAADDIGRQCGGWTISWLGARGATTPGTTVLAGLRAALEPATRVEFNAAGAFTGRAPLGIAVIAEEPYAEGHGDRAALDLPPDAMALVIRLRGCCDRLVLVLLSGRPLIVTGLLPLVDALVAAWLPGTEGAGVADGLTGAAPFTGRLSYAWPRANAQLPLGPVGGDPLFPVGFGLTC